MYFGAYISQNLGVFFGFHMPPSGGGHHMSKGCFCTGKIKSAKPLKLFVLQG